MTQRVLYEVIFKEPFGKELRLDTFDQEKIGPWLADMFGVFPYNASMPSNVTVRAWPQP